MIKVFEDFNFTRVGQMQSLLESHGIRTFIRNEYGSSVVGELPFVEVIPQLYVLEEKDAAKAIELLNLDLPAEDSGEQWVCPECGVDVEGNFSRCWKCGVNRRD
ncbi:MAG: DUF2007 domain-containing protein [Xanthomonadales bacterium]|nr:DUF2007 domain-containing protein [Gammaproteobacteria bacterium]MBT8054795.1 DUF2007 domain-containing protein [Gammaproteobacteria bacterium]NND56867.1 DUF2007 domain-containing protein [Xanthomonadales bacterium]NNK51060.1 DUF2007 domain-containing protein [Xanthomonadales bacterium]